MKVMENLETEELATVSGGCVVIVLMLHPGLKIMPFKLTGSLQNEVKRRKIQAKKEKNAKCMALQRQMESSQQRQTRLQDISAHKTICSQLETLEILISNFIL